MNQMLDTRRDKRMDEARRVFNEMQRLLTRIMEDDEIPCHIGVDLGNQINTVLDRAALVAF